MDKFCLDSENIYFHIWRIVMMDKTETRKKEIAMNKRHCFVFITWLFCFTCSVTAQSYNTYSGNLDPYTFQERQFTLQLKSSKASVREAAIERLSMMRSYDSASIVAKFISDENVAVRREAVMNLGLTGNYKSIKPLFRALSDSDWSVRQAAVYSLQNLTASKLPFNALSEEADRFQEVLKWRSFIKSFKLSKLIETVNSYQPSVDGDYYAITDVIRAVGFMRIKTCEKTLIKLLSPYLEKSVDPKLKESTVHKFRSEKLYVQALIRTIGRTGGNSSRDLLIKFLEKPQWASYAADALGDLGGKKSVAALIDAYPNYSFPVKGRERHRNSYHNYVKKYHAGDAPHLCSTDRIPRVAHMILQSLCRIKFSDKENIVALQKITPNILATMPSMFDATLVYELEPYQMFAGYLLEKCDRRQAAVDAAFEALNMGNRKIDRSLPEANDILKLASDNINSKKSTDMPFVGTILMSCARDKADIPLLIELLKHDNGWIKIDAAKTLMFLEAKPAIPALKNLLATAKDDADYGYDMDFRRFRHNNVKGNKLPGEGYDEYNDPSPRFKEAFIMTLGGLKVKSADSLLIKYLNNGRNVMEIQYAAACALYQIATPKALEALRIAEAHHPFESVRQVAREAVWMYGLKAKKLPNLVKTRRLKQLPVPKGKPEVIVFIKGDKDAGNHEQISSDHTGYSTTDAGPTYRLGRNIFKYHTVSKKLTQLTHFTEGFVADLEVSYDGEKILFAYRGRGDGPKANPWWHVCEINADGSGFRQITDGPYHDVQPNYMPDGRIIFSTSRIGMRDEYHGYAATALAVMNYDGSDIHLIGFNLGRDAEPVVADDGKILFSRLELFYSRMKTEWNLLTAFPDGTKPMTIYGPERREFWKKIRGAAAITPPRHRTLRITQPQSWNGAQHLINSFQGPMLAGPGHGKEQLLFPNLSWALTTPYKIDLNTLLVAAGKRDVVGENRVNIMTATDLGLYYLDIKSQELSLIYNDPAFAEFEARPLQPRKIPPILPGGAFTRSRQFTGQVLCNTIYNSRIPAIERGRFIRITEGEPTVQRHQTHMNGGIAWRNHGGAIGRDLGVVPVAKDGSFSINVPSDRLFHIQVLDADRNVIGNELIWQYARPGESKSCVGCHENPDVAPSGQFTYPLAIKQPALDCLPNQDDIKFRAKLWFKGWTPDEREERMHTVNSITVIGRQ